MNGVNGAATAIFNALLAPLEMLGSLAALVIISGIFGIIALVVFKHISWQAGIRATKDKIKGDMIAIRLYQDDLTIVGKSVGKVFFRNFEYLGLNFGPILPLLIPFTLVAAQFVVRYAFDPLEVTVVEEGADKLQGLAGKGTEVEVVMKKGSEGKVTALTLVYPDGIVPVSPLVRNEHDGVAFQEVIATKSVKGEIELLVDGKMLGTKAIVAGDERERLMQPERVSSFWYAWLWPAEPTFDASCPIESVKFEYPARSLWWMFSGPFGVILLFFVASVVFGVLVLKPLNIQI